MGISLKFPHTSVLGLKVFEFETKMHKHDDKMKENDDPYAGTNLRIVAFKLIQSRSLLIRRHRAIEIVKIIV